MLSVLNLHATEPDLELPQEAPPIIDVDGVPSVTVPVQFLRNALWYYDNYFIQKELSDTRGDLLTECQADYQLCITDLSQAEDRERSLQREVLIWKGVTIAVGTAGIVTAIFLGVAQ